MKHLPYILLLALCGCVATKPTSGERRAESGLPPSPLTAQSAVRSQQSEVSQGSDLAAIVLPPEPTITATWLNNNTDDAEVITGLQSSADWVNWQTLFETNCVDVTNRFTMPRPDGFVLFRNFNRRDE